MVPLAAVALPGQATPAVEARRAHGLVLTERRHAQPAGGEPRQQCAPLRVVAPNPFALASSCHHRCLRVVDHGSKCGQGLSSGEERRVVTGYVGPS